MTKLAWFIGAVTLLACGTYVFIYLARWEWHRALFVAVLFVAAEIAMATALLLRRVGDGASAPAGTYRDEPDPAVLERIRSAPSDRDHFAWLRRDLSRTNVFLTALLGGGVVLSAGAWAIDRLAHRTAGRSVDRSLAQALGGLSFPAGGLLPDDAELVASDAPERDDPDLRLLLGPGGQRR